MVVLTGITPGCKSVTSPEPEPAAETFESLVKAKKWLFLLYDDADFANGYDPLDDFARLTGSNENVNVLVLQDTDLGPAKIWYVDENNQVKLLKELGEVNMGTSDTLKDFVQYAKNLCSPEKTILAFYDHGSGWRGACIDETSGDTLTMNEIQTALRQTGGVNIVCFTAPCLMGAVESAYELRHQTEVYIGSEDLSGFVYWYTPVREICETLQQNPDISTIDLSVSIIESVYESSKYSKYARELTMSAIRTDRLGEFVNATNDVVNYLSGNLEQFSPLIDSVYPSVLSFSTYGYLDAYDLFEKLHESTIDAQLQTKLERVMQSIDNAVIAECHGWERENAHGLSIYFPDNNEVNYTFTYESSDYGLDFSANSQWDEFLKRYLGVNDSSSTQSQTDDFVLPETDGFVPEAFKKKSKQ